jgi:GT2 family glycosyltransferase
MKTTIIIPAFQPGKSLLTLMEELTIDPKQVILLVDDGSTGESEGIIREIETRWHQVTVLHRAANLCKGQLLFVELIQKLVWNCYC